MADNESLYPPIADPENLAVIRRRDAKIAASQAPNPHEYSTTDRIEVAFAGLHGIVWTCHALDESATRFKFTTHRIA